METNSIPIEPAGPGVWEARDEFSNPTYAVVGSSRLDGFVVAQTSHVFGRRNPTLAHYLAGVDGPSNRRVFLTLSPTVQLLYGHEIHAYFKSYEIQVVPLPLERYATPESAKSSEAYWEFMGQLVKMSPSAGDVVVVVAGGAATDMVKTAIATYRRGKVLRALLVPSTPIGQLDEALCRKTAVNVHYTKNACGGEITPAGVLLDPSLLNSVSEQHQRDGLAEAFKAALVGDPDLVNWIESDGDGFVAGRFQSGSATRFLWDACGVYLRLAYHPLSTDRTNTVRSFGHPISRHIEGWSRFQITHGVAIALEMLFALTLSKNLGHLGQADYDRIVRCMIRLKLVNWIDGLLPDALWNHVFAGLEQGHVSFDYPILTGIGNPAYVDSFALGDLTKAMATVEKMAIRSGRVWSVFEPASLI